MDGIRQSEHNAANFLRTTFDEGTDGPIADVGIIYGGWWSKATSPLLNKSVALRHVDGLEIAEGLESEDHALRVMFGEIAGRKVIGLDGRLHPWDKNHVGMKDACRLQVEMLAEAGAQTIILTSGGYVPKYEQSHGDSCVYAIKELIVPLGVDLHLHGNEDFDPNQALGSELADLAVGAVKDLKLDVVTGDYLAREGAHRISRNRASRFINLFGGHVIGSTLGIEIAAAAACGVKAIPLCFAPNTDKHETPSHEVFRELAAKHGNDMRLMISNIIEKLPKNA